MTDWRPIDTAPEDGTRVLVWNGYEVWISSRRLNKHASKPHPTFGPGTGHDWFIGDRAYRPTHWAPIPESPR